METMDLSRVVELKEDGFTEKDLYPDAPVDYEDAVDNYKRVLDIVGQIAGDYVAPRSRSVDTVGAHLVDGEVILAPGTQESLEQLKKADLMGFTLPRKYGGINMPITIYMAAIELISRADASLMLLFGLQGIGEMISRFGTEDQQARFLPRFSTGGAMGAMALTEPDAGSDLQAAALRAEQKEDGKWYLNGVKRFITNGCADISLVMARSEKDVAGARGLSLFIYERDSHLTIRRIEDKLGLHGSPTCELQFNDAGAELLGKRKFGLVKYTFELLNGARLAVAAQAIGIAEAAYRDANIYAKNRIQFKRPIQEFSAVYEMLVDMKIGIEAGRSLLYETARLVDIQNSLEKRSEIYPDQAKAIRNEAKQYVKYASLFTPMVKAYATEMANKVCYQAIQIHGGVGYCTEFDVERYYRDVRVTNIYEGTTQLQIVAASGGILGGVIFERLDDFERDHDFSLSDPVVSTVRKMRSDLESTVSHIKEKQDPVFQEHHAGRIVEMASNVMLGYLLYIDGLVSDRKRKIAMVFTSKTAVRVRAIKEYILSDNSSLMDFHKDIINNTGN